MCMRNKFLLGLVTISIGLNLFLLVGCDDSQLAQAYASKRLYCVDSEWTTVKGRLVVDAQTGVEYWYIEPNAGEGGSYSLTLLVDSEGKPVIWKGE